MSLTNQTLHPALYAQIARADHRLPASMANAANRWVPCQAVAVAAELGRFADALGVDGTRLQLDHEAAASAGSPALVYRVAALAVDVPPALLLGRIDAEGADVVALARENVPSLGVQWVAYFGSLRSGFGTEREARRAIGPRRHARDSWQVFGLFVAAGH